LFSLVFFSLFSSNSLKAEESKPSVLTEALDTYTSDGIGAFLTKLGNDPKAIQEIQTWCQAQGGTQKIEFPIHSSASTALAYFKLILKDLGLTCVNIEPKFVDSPDSTSGNGPTLMDIKAVKPDKTAFYERIKKFRAIAVPLVGFGITMWAVINSLKQDLSLTSFAQHGGELSQATMKGLLEFQFAYFTAYWRDIFSMVELPIMKQTSAKYFKLSFATFTNIFKKSFALLYNPAASKFNGVVDRSGKVIRASFLWISAVNILAYPFLMGVAGEIGSHVFGPSNNLIHIYHQLQNMGYLETVQYMFSSLGSVASAGVNTVRDQFMMSMAFNSTIMLFQDRLGWSTNINRLNEYRRLFIETFPVLLFNTFRGVSVIYPKYEVLMSGLQLAIGGLLSGFFLSDYMSNMMA
jgi:hypothetical protein